MLLHIELFNFLGHPSGHWPLNDAYPYFFPQQYTLPPFPAQQSIPLQSNFVYAFSTHLPTKFSFCFHTFPQIQERKRKIYQLLPNMRKSSEKYSPHPPNQTENWSDSPQIGWNLSKPPKKFAEMDEPPPHILGIPPSGCLWHLPLSIKSQIKHPWQIITFWRPILNTLFYILEMVI